MSRSKPIIPLILGTFIDAVELKKEINWVLVVYLLFIMNISIILISIIPISTSFLVTDEIMK